MSLLIHSETDSNIEDYHIMKNLETAVISRLLCEKSPTIALEFGDDLGDIHTF